MRKIVSIVLAVVMLVMMLPAASATGTASVPLKLNLYTSGWNIGEGVETLDKSDNLVGYPKTKAIVNVANPAEGNYTVVIYAKYADLQAWNYTGSSTVKGKAVVVPLVDAADASAKIFVNAGVTEVKDYTMVLRQGGNSVELSLRSYSAGYPLGKLTIKYVDTTYVANPNYHICDANCSYTSGCPYFSGTTYPGYTYPSYPSYPGYPGYTYPGYFYPTYPNYTPNVGGNVSYYPAGNYCYYTGSYYLCFDSVNPLITGSLFPFYRYDAATKTYLKVANYEEWLALQFVPVVPGGAPTKPATPVVDNRVYTDLTSDIALKVGKTTTLNLRFGGELKKDLVWNVCPGSENIVKINAKGAIEGVANGTGYVYTTYNGVNYRVKITVSGGSAPAAPSTGTATGARYKITGSAIYVRPAMNTKQGWIGVLTKGSVITGYEIKDGWMRVNYEGQTGYIYAKYTTPVK